MSYTALYYHIVFRTYGSEPVIPDDSKRMLFAYINSFCGNHKCKLLRINGYHDHIHMLVAMPANICVADFVRDVKTSTSKAFRSHNLFPGFRSWAGRYAALTVSYYELPKIKQYIINQEEHHRYHSFREELTQLLEEYGIEVPDIWRDDDV